MVDVNEYPAQLRGDCKLDIIRALQGLPISTRNAVEDSKVIKVCFLCHFTFENFTFQRPKCLKSISYSLPFVRL